MVPYRAWICLALTLVWVMAGFEQVHLHQSGWNVSGCFVLAIAFAVNGLDAVKKL